MMDNKENMPAHLKQEVDEAQKEAVARMEIEYELRNEIKYKDFFANYNPEDVEEFIKAYSGRKVTWISWGKFYYEHNEDHQLRFYNQAQECLWQIQQKKLFNLQCQWRAEKIKIAGILSSIDFRYWESNIKQCSFIPPITHWEFEMYMDYLQNDDEVEIDPAEADYEFEWQDYLRFVDDYGSVQDEDELIIPLWYQFYDNRMGTDSLMTLPDTRGEKESKYLKAYYEHINKVMPDEKADLFRSDRKDSDYLSVYNPNIIEKFVRTYEDKEIIKYFVSYEKSHKPMEFADELAEMAFKELRELNEEIPIKASADWREALIDAWEDYRRKQIVKLLPLVYEDYLQKQELGISYQAEETKEVVSEMEEWRTAIIKGRELMLEPPDFNF